MAGHSLNERQSRFVDEYIITGVAETAALNAGYSDTYARSHAHRLVANIGIKKSIDERNTQIESNKIADMVEVKEFWTDTMRNEDIEVKDRMRASDFIAKTNGAYLERIKQTQQKQIDVQWISELNKKYLKS